ncbi:MAG: DUF1287 domain-containing protein [Nonlabens sp.]
MKNLYIFILFLVHPLVGVHAQTDFATRLAAAAQVLTQDNVTYNGSYFAIDYPMGDVPAQYGVCTDVIIRAYRGVGIDLQKLIHEDMKTHFDAYPNNWGLTRTDTNIDHRRVPNIRRFMKRNNADLPVTQNAADYQPGDVVSWILPNNLTHIGIVSNLKNESKSRYLMVHNIGAGQVLEDCLFSYKITGHYRYGK